MNFKYSMGALFSKPDVRDFVASTTQRDFPKEFKLNLPKVKDQGNVGSCVAHSLALIIEYFNEIESNAFVEMSIGYIYGNRRLSTYKGSGMYTRDAIKTAVKYGDVIKNLMPNNIEVPEAINVFEEKVEEIENKGIPFRIAEYFKLNSIESIKTSLMDNGPVIMTMNWWDDIEIVDGIMKTSQKNSTGGHCMVIYGWNEKGWLVRNSWGKEWGDNGNCIIPFDIKFKEIWGIKDAITDSDLVLNKPFSSDFGKILAKVLNFILNLINNIINNRK